MKVMIIGATSAIAQETAKLFAQEGAALFLVGRNTKQLTMVRDDLTVRGSNQVETFCLDLTDLDRHQELFESAVTALDGLDIVLIAYGTLGDQKASEQSITETVAQWTTNCTSVISLLTIVANYFERKKHGCIAVIASVAGDRGRQSNYIYGSAKGAVSLFLQGLRQRLFKSQVRVVTLKPGFVDTPMTASLPKNVLYAHPQRVGKAIFRAIIKGKDVVYIPWFWRPIMMIVRNIPENIFKKLNL